MGRLKRERFGRKLMANWHSLSCLPALLQTTVYARVDGVCAWGIFGAAALIHVSAFGLYIY